MPSGGYHLFHRRSHSAGVRPTRADEGKESTLILIGSTQWSCNSATRLSSELHSLWTMRSSRLPLLLFVCLVIAAVGAACGSSNSSNFKGGGGDDGSTGDGTS